ncbi:MAG: MFS transporter [Bdellovibrionales bacterium]
MRLNRSASLAKPEPSSCSFSSEGFGAYLQAIMVSRLGSQLSYTALTLWVAYQFDSGAAAGWLTALPLMAGWVTAVLAGPYIDRYPPKLLMITADLANVFATLLMAVLLQVSAESNWVLGGVLMLRMLSAAATAVFEPAGQVLLPQMVAPAELMRANSRVAASRSCSHLIGESFGGILFQWMNVSGLFVLDSVSYVVSAALLGRVRERRFGPVERPGFAPSTVRPYSFRQEFKMGLLYIQQEKGLRETLIASLSLNFLLQPIGLVLAFFIKKQLRLGAEWYGFLLGLFTLSHLFSSYLSSRWIDTFRSRAQGGAGFFSFHIFGLGLSQLLLFASSNVALTAIALILMGLAQGPVNVMILTAIQSQTPPALQGRVHSLLMALFGISAPLGALVAGHILDLLQVQVHLWFLGAFLVCMGVCAYGMRTHHLGKYLFP